MRKIINQTKKHSISKLKKNKKSNNKALAVIKIMNLWSRTINLNPRNFNQNQTYLLIFHKVR